MRQPLKSLHEIMERDQRNWGFVINNSQTGQERQFTLKDLHAEIEVVQLAEAVPEDVREQWDIVRNLLLYSWFVYDFSSAAFMVANAATEMALVKRCELEDGSRMVRSPGLRKLLKRAASSDWILDGDFSHLEKSYSDPAGKKYTETLCDVLPAIRNSLAHGSPFLMSPMQIVGSVDINAHLINALFRDSAKSTLK